MGHRAGQKEESRARLLVSAGRGFRSHGYDGLGVDRLATEAGVTSGGFYAHYKSKAAAFREAVVAGMASLCTDIEHLRETLGGDWRQGFIDFYLSERRTCDLADSCALQSLTGEVARADAETREAYEVELRKVIDATAANIAPGLKAERQEATALLVLLVGGVSLARAVKSPTLSEEIAESIRWAAKKLEQHDATPAKRNQ